MAANHSSTWTEEETSHKHLASDRSIYFVYFFNGKRLYGYHETQNIKSAAKETCCMHHIQKPHLSAFE